MFLKHLKRKIERADTDYANIDNCIVGPDGVTKGHVVFIKQHEDVDQNSAFLESGASLSTAHVGYTDLASTGSRRYIPIGINSPIAY